MGVLDRRMCFVLWTLLTLWVPDLEGALMSDYESLASDLFTNYRKQLRPLFDDQFPTTVYMAMRLSSIQELDEINQQLTFTAYLDVYWEDPNLSWNPASYNNTYYFTYPQSDVWIPDITISNSVENLKELGFDRNYLYVTASGAIYWIPGGVFKTSCDVDVTYYPFDTQECHVIFTTLASTIRQVDLEFNPYRPVDLSWYSKSGSWDLQDVVANNVSDASEYSRVAFTIKIKRLRTYYVVTIIMPVIFLCFTATLVFALPADSGEKMGTSITVLLAFAVYLTIVSDQMPKTSLQVSLLAVYLTMLLGQTAMGVVLSVWILNLYFRDDEKPPGKHMRAVVIFLQRVMCKRPWNDKVEPWDEGAETTNDSTTMITTLGDALERKERPMSDFKRQLHALQEEATKEPEMTWQSVSYTLDRFLFYTFSAVLFLSTIIFMTVLAVGPSQ